MTKLQVSQAKKPIVCIHIPGKKIISRHKIYYIPMHFIIHGNILISTRISLVKVQSNQNKPCKSTSL